MGIIAVWPCENQAQHPRAGQNFELDHLCVRTETHLVLSTHHYREHRTTRRYISSRDFVAAGNSPCVRFSFRIREALLPQKHVAARS